MQRPEEHPASAIRPSLLSTSTEVGAANDRILANFETSISGHLKSASIGHFYQARRFLPLGMLAILMAGAAGVAYFKVLPVHQKPVVNTPSLALPAVSASVGNSPHAGDVIEQKFGATLEKQGATVISEPEEPRRTAELEKVERRADSNLPEKSLAEKSSSRAIGTIPTRSDNVPKTEEIRLTSNAGSKGAGQEPTVHARSSQSLDASHKNLKSLKQSNASSKEKQDRDVAVLAALMANNYENQTSPAKTGQRAVNRIQRPTKSKALSASIPNRADSENARDVVERKPNDTSEALLQRCKQLGFVEGQLCRWRICSGLWESDAACKASAGQT